MFVSNTLSLLSLLAVSAPLANALGCYSGGPTFSDLSGGSVDGAIQHFCRTYKPANFAPGQIITHCYPFPENNSRDRVQMELKNNDGNSQQGLSYDDCVHNFSVERGACAHGSEQNHGSFFYRIDPNNGKC